MGISLAREGIRAGQQHNHLNNMVQVAHTHPCCNLQGSGTSESRRFACRKGVGIHTTQIDIDGFDLGKHSHGVD